MSGWFYRIAKRYTEYPEIKKICKHSSKEHMTPDADGTLRSTHTCYRRTGRMKRNYFYCIVEFFPSGGAIKGNLWTSDNMAPMGDTKEDLIESLKLMLKDAKKYGVLHDTKEAWKPTHS